jgi:glycosyltransferase involved in cell wall biosynthesis
MVDPYSTDAIAAGLEQLAEDQALRDQLIRLGAEHVRAFSWDAAAAKLRQIYASLA